MTDKESNDSLLQLVKEQAKDESIWLLNPTVTEAYILQELRKLHSAVEKYFKDDR